MVPEIESGVPHEAIVMNPIETGKPLGLMHGTVDFMKGLPVFELGTAAIALYGFRKMLETFTVKNTNER